MKSLTKAEKVPLLSLLTSLGLFCFQLFMSAISGSIALFADALHSGTDMVSSFLVFLSLRLNRQVEDGSEKARKAGIAIENTLIGAVGLFIAFAAYNIFDRAFGASPSALSNLWFVLPGTGVSIVVAYLLASYKMRVGQETNNYILIADGRHSLSDVLSSTVVLVGLLGGMAGLNLERVAAFIIGLLILKSALDILFNSVRGLVRQERVAVDAESWGILLQRRIAVLPGIGPALDQAMGRLKATDPFAPIERLVQRMKDKPSTAGTIGTAAALLLYLSSGLFVIPPDSIGTKLRFGKIIEDGIGPGLGYCWPWPAGKIIMTESERIRRVEIGFRTKTDVPPGGFVEPYAYVWEFQHENARLEKRLDESVVITGDEYFMDINLTVQYKVIKPADYHFRVSDIDVLIRFLTMDYMNRLANQATMTEVLTTSRTAIEHQIALHLQKYADELSIGVKILGICFRDVHPPVQVVSAFRAVASAKEDRDKMINQAHGYANEVVAVARGKAKKMVIDARREQTQRVRMAEGIARGFASREQAFRRSPVVSKTRLYLETIEKVLIPVDKLVIEKRAGKSGTDYQQLYMFDKVFNTGRGK